MSNVHQMTLLRALGKHLAPNWSAMSSVPLPADVNESAASLVQSYHEGLDQGEAKVQALMQTQDYNSIQSVIEGLERLAACY